MKKGEEETDWEAEERRQSRCIWLSGQRGLTEREAALLIIHEARSLLQEDLHQMGGELAPHGGTMWHVTQHSILFLIGQVIIRHLFVPFSTFYMTNTML